MEAIRVGQVSSINYKEGMIKILYKDRDNAVTDELPVISFNDEYKMPQVGDYVLVLHLSNGMEAGYVLGTFWNDGNTPAIYGKNVYRKEYGENQGEAYTQYKDGQLKISADSILLSCSAGSITLAKIINHIG